jgi:hypothetical protein
MIQRTLTISVEQVLSTLVASKNQGLRETANLHLLRREVLPTSRHKKEVSWAK